MGRTVMIQMLPKLHIPMPPCRQMKISLHLIPLQTPVNPTRLRLQSSLHPRRLPKLPLLTPHLTKHMPYMCILLHLFHHLPTLQFVYTPIHINPLLPTRGVPLQHVAG